MQLIAGVVCEKKKKQPHLSKRPTIIMIRIGLLIQSVLFSPSVDSNTCTAKESHIAISSLKTSCWTARASTRALSTRHPRVVMLYLLWHCSLTCPYLFWYLGTLKISDFGLATVFKYGGRTRPLETPCGSAPYVAPEVMILSLGSL